MKSRPASSLSADSGNGTIRRQRIIWKMWANDQFAGSQSLLSVFTQISPTLETFGWKILVSIYPLGGLAGKSLSITSLHLNIPP